MTPNHHPKFFRLVTLRHSPMLRPTVTPIIVFHTALGVTLTAYLGFIFSNGLAQPMPLARGF